MADNQAVAKENLDSLLTHPAIDILHWISLAELCMTRVREINGENLILDEKIEKYINFVIDKVVMDAKRSLSVPVKQEKARIRKHKAKLSRYKKHIARSLAKILEEDTSPSRNWGGAYSLKDKI